MKIRHSNMKTERVVRIILRSVKTLKNYKFLAKIGPKTQKFKIPLPKNLMRTVPRNIPMRLHTDGLYILLSTQPPSSVGTKNLNQQ